MGSFKMLLEVYSAIFYDLVIKDEISFHWIKGQKLFTFGYILVILLSVVNKRFCVDMSHHITNVIVFFQYRWNGWFYIFIAFD